MENENVVKSKDENINDKLLEVIEQRFDVEAIAQMVEQIGFSKNLSQKLTQRFGGLQRGVTNNNQLIHMTQEELRNIVLDVELLKRAVTSLGQIGVMERKKIEKELILQLCPPCHSRAGIGVRVFPAKPVKPVKLDCLERLPICKAACCRIFSAYLTSNEVESGRYEWDPRKPYALTRNRYGCIYLQNGGCACTRYDSRPNACMGYSCMNDRRIWADYEKRVLNPHLKEQLDKLHVAESHENQTPVNPDSKMKINGSFSSNGTKNTNRFNTDSAVNNESIAPPDFTELREMMALEPVEKFTPPESQKVDDEAAEIFDNVEQDDKA